MTLSFFLAARFARRGRCSRRCLADHGRARVGGRSSVIVFLLSSGLLFGLLRTRRATATCERPAAAAAPVRPALIGKTAMVTGGASTRQSGAVKLEGEVWTGAPPRTSADEVHRSR